MNTSLFVYDKKSESTIISFTGVAHMMNNIPKKEFMSLLGRDDYNMIFAIDHTKSWYNSLDVEKIKRNIVGNNKIITIGNSMGAFNATMFANDYDVDLVIAFSTQYSIKKDIVPWETRWRDDANNIRKWKYDKLELNNTTEYHFISGDELKEQKHIDMIPNKNNVYKHVVKGSGHGAALYLKNKGILGKFINEIIEGKNKRNMVI